MGTYRPLYSLRVEHDYYDNLACRALAFRLKAGGVDLCRRRGLLFRQTAVNEWTLLYDCDSAGMDTSSDKVEAELCITDPAFVLFTDWAALRPENAYTLELPASRDTVEAAEAIRESADRRRIGSGFCSVSILMTEKILAAAQKEKHKTCTLRFHAPQCKWELYIQYELYLCLKLRYFLVISSFWRSLVAWPPFWYMNGSGCAKLRLKRQT